jgi:hypothetical protein
MNRARTYRSTRMRHRIEQSNGLVPSLLCPSWVDCIIATRGYDFRKGHHVIRNSCPRWSGARNDHTLYRASSPVAATVLEYGGSDIVHACSDSVVNAAAGQQKEEWRTRKTRYIEHLKTVDRETRLVSLSDKVYNARSILRDLRKPEIGPAVWTRFGKRPKEDTLWYYRELAKAFQELLPSQLAEELMEIVIVLENE